MDLGLSCGFPTWSAPFREVFQVRDRCFQSGGDLFFKSCEAQVEAVLTSGRIRERPTLQTRVKSG